jgi:hypothetical protein
MLRNGANMKGVKMAKTVESLLVAYDCTNGVDKSVLCVGQKTNGQPVKIINALQGAEAEEVWKKLTGREDSNDQN